jgi:outer membrane protein OmpA-like peptidoglycan-associated protein
VKAFIIYILSLFVVVGCSSMGEKQKKGTAIGAASGGAVGAVLGNKSGSATKGAAIGAAAGAAIGTVLGKRMDEQAKELEKVAETERTEEGITTKLKGDILFDVGEAKLKNDAEKRIKELSMILKKYPENRIAVVGHTDNTGDASYNQTLSEQRANAVRIEMLENGVPGDAVRTAGLGEAQPVSSNNSGDGRAKNRRVELKITAEEKAVK